jgi:hypothetical protein
MGMASDGPKAEPLAFLRDLALVFHDETGAATYPRLMELLAPKYGAKKQLLRQEGTLRISIRGDVLLVKIDCPTERVTGSVEIASLANIMTDIEDSIGRGLVRWEADWNSRKSALTRLEKSVE